MNNQNRKRNIGGKSFSTSRKFDNGKVVGRSVVVESKSGLKSRHTDAKGQKTTTTMKEGRTAGGRDYFSKKVSYGKGANKKKETTQVTKVGRGIYTDHFNFDKKISEKSKPRNMGPAMKSNEIPGKSTPINKSFTKK